MNFSKIREWTENNTRRIILAGLGLVMIGGGVFSWRSSDLTETEGVKILSAESDESELVVDVEGAVTRPGVYRLKNGFRVDDALIAAGNLHETADFQWVEMNLNRSAKLTDGMKIYIPQKSEKVQGIISREQGGKIDINTAGMGELDKLPGVGEVTAGKIISGRPYTQTEELLQKKIVSQKVWEQIKELISTW